MNNHNARLSKTISPLNQRNVTPELQHTKFMRENMDTIGGESNGPILRQFNESPLSTDYLGKNRRRENKENDDYINRTLSQINLELDNNMNEIIYCFNRRKQLVSIKKRKMKDEMDDKIEKAGKCGQDQWNQYSNDAQFMKIASFSGSPRSAVSILSKMIRSLPSFENGRGQEDNKSQYFWARNRKLQNQIDTMLAKLRLVDKNLQKTNGEVIDICKNLDVIQDNLKNLIGLKASQNVQKVQPLFLNKNRNYQALNQKINERQEVKDSKIDYVKSIKEALNQLKGLREERIRQIEYLFGSNLQELERVGVRDQDNLTTAFEALLKMKEKDSYLQLQEKQSWNQIQAFTKEQDQFYAQLLKRQSEEAKSYHNYSKIMLQRVKYRSIMNIFGVDQEVWANMSMDPKQLTKKFKEYKGTMKRFLEEDSLIKQGLLKTNQTMKTFVNILKATENQKDRRQQLLRVLQRCIKRKSEYQQKKQELRKLLIDQTRNQQERGQFQEQLQLIVSDGDIDSYKKIGNAIGKCDNDRNKLARAKVILEKELDEMDKQVVGMANHMQEEYEDILCQIIPSDYDYSLRNGEDVKKIRNYIRKMYKRLGIIKSE